MSYESSYGNKSLRWDSADGPITSPRSSVRYSKYLEDAFLTSTNCHILESNTTFDGRSTVTLDFGLMSSTLYGKDIFYKWSNTKKGIDIVPSKIFEDNVVPFTVSNCVCFDDVTLISAKVYKNRIRLTSFVNLESNINRTNHFDIICGVNERTTSLKTVCLDNGVIQVFYITDGVFTAISANALQSYVEWLFDVDKATAISNAAYSIKTKTTRIVSFDGNTTLSLYKIDRRRGDPLETTRILIKDNISRENAYENTFHKNVYAYTPRLYTRLSNNDEESLVIEYKGSSFFFHEKYDRTRFYDVFEMHVDRSDLCGLDAVALSEDPFEKDEKRGYCFGFSDTGEFIMSHADSKKNIHTIQSIDESPVRIGRVKTKYHFLYSIGHADDGCHLIWMDGKKLTYNVTIPFNACDSVGIDDRFAFIVNDIGSLCILS